MITASDTPRSEVDIGTKLRSEDLAAQAAVEHADALPERLDVDTIEVRSVHWSMRSVERESITLRAFDCHCLCGDI